MNVVTSFQHGGIVARRDVDWPAFQRSEKVHHATSKACTCIFFRCNPFHFCKHQIAVDRYMTMFSSPRSLPNPPAVTPVRALATIHPNVPNELPAKRRRSRSRSAVVTFVGDVTPPIEKSWIRPRPREENSLQRSRSVQKEEA